MPANSYSFAVLLALLAVKTGAASVVSGLSVLCSETTNRAAQGAQDCANAWVHALMAADDTSYIQHSHEVGIAAGSTWKSCDKTDQEQSCIDNWINLRQPASLLRGIVDGDCLTAMRLPSQKELAAAGFDLDHIREFMAWYEQHSNGVSWYATQIRQCLLDWVLRQQRALKEDGGVCAFMATTGERNACIDKWVTGIINQERGQAASSSASNEAAQPEEPAAAAGPIDGDQATGESATADGRQVSSDDGAAAATAAAVPVDPPPVKHCARGKRGRLFRFPEDLSRPVCIDDWVNAKLCHRQGSCLTSCSASCTARFATPAAQRACVMSWLEAQQILSRSYGSLAAAKLCTPANFPEDAALQECYNSYVLAAHMEYKGDDSLGFGEVCAGPYGAAVMRRDCVLKLIKAGTGGRCEALSAAVARQRCERRWIALQQVRDAWWALPVVAVY